MCICWLILMLIYFSQITNWGSTIFTHILLTTWLNNFFTNLGQKEDTLF
jgi:hypothetical protein